MPFHETLSRSKFVLLGICLVLGLGLGLQFALSYWEMQQAWRWWVERDLVERASYADQIQNGLLQDLFALRLGLGSASPDQLQLFAQTLWLSDAEKLHNQLNQLSTALLPAYLPDSLPLAIQALFQQWQTHHPSCRLSLNLPTDWSHEPLARSCLILATLKRFLEIIALSAPIALMTVDLRQQNGKATLTIQLTFVASSARTATAHAKDLKYLRRCFQCFVSGECHYRLQALEATWQLSWKQVGWERTIEHEFGD